MYAFACVCLSQSSSNVHASSEIYCIQKHKKQKYKKQNKTVTSCIIVLILISLVLVHIKVGRVACENNFTNWIYIYIYRCTIFRGLCAVWTGHGNDGGDKTSTSSMFIDILAIRRQIVWWCDETPRPRAIVSNQSSHQSKLMLHCQQSSHIICNVIYRNVRNEHQYELRHHKFMTFAFERWMPAIAAARNKWWWQMTNDEWPMACLARKWQQCVVDKGSRPTILILICGECHSLHFQHWAYRKAIFEIDSTCDK